MKVKGYKVFNYDWTCRGFKFEIGKEYHQDGEIILCENGFHFCRKLKNCFSYYNFDPNNKVAEIEASGNIIGDEDDKECCENIKIIREISWEEVLILVNTGNKNTGHSNTGNKNTGHSNTGNKNTGHDNTGNKNTGHDNTGHSNTGDWNTGDSNTGHSNTGHSNTGDWNTGDWNTGDWNTGDWNTGFFNTVTPDNILIFNKLSKREDWEKCIKPDFIYFNLTKFIYEPEMTEIEKSEHEEYKTIGGYLKKYSYKEAFYNSWKNTSEEDRRLIFGLPNFDIKIFSEISGIPVKELKKYK